jgi:hypothetical protein
MVTAAEQSLGKRHSLDDTMPCHADAAGGRLLELFTAFSNFIIALLDFHLPKRKFRNVVLFGYENAPEPCAQLLSFSRRYPIEIIA